jgi:hypothetical protein
MRLAVSAPGSTGQLPTWKRTEAVAKSQKARTKEPQRIRRRADYEQLTPHEQESFHRAYEAIAEMRRREVSLTVAAHRVGTTSATVLRYAPEVIVKDGRRYQVTRSDRSYLRMSVLSTEGLRDIDTRGSRVRSLVGAHWSAIGRFAATGDVGVLRPFIGKRTGGVELASDPDLIEEYLRQGELDIDDIYV